MTDDLRYDPHRSGTNVLAIAAFVTSFFGFVVGIVLGFVALAQIRRTGEQGHGLALAAVIIGIAGAALVLLIVIALVIAAAVAVTVTGATTTTIGYGYSSS